MTAGGVHNEFHSDVVRVQRLGEAHAVPDRNGSIVRCMHEKRRWRACRDIQFI
jgi:hypothetical protein